MVNVPNRSPTLREWVDVRTWSKVIGLRSEDGNSWNEHILRQLCNGDSVEAILKMPWLNDPKEDQAFWIGNNVGVFSVGNCFDISWNCGVADSILWDKLWKSKLHDQLKFFI